MKFTSKYLFKGLPSKADIIIQAFEKIKEGTGLSRYDMSNDDNIKDVLHSVYKAGLKRGKNKTFKTKQP
jgi:hypothetical protein